jgi:hypothetical protein
MSNERLSSLISNTDQIREEGAIHADNNSFLEVEEFTDSFYPKPSLFPSLGPLLGIPVAPENIYCEKISDSDHG